MKTTLLLGRALLIVLATQLAGPATAVAQNRPPNLNQLSIEDLMSLEITSASRKEQLAADVAAAVFVITSADIRRSGMTTIPDLLRMVPGVNVAQINANKWAVSVRGFNGIRANKLLILVDGRSVYNRLFSGVLWDEQDLLVDDIDRIEVIRGPGAAMWGANAVNGVINIVTKAATDTLGGLVRIDGGGSGAQGAVRYGGTLGHAHYRLFAQWTGVSESLIAPGTGADDRSQSVRTGFRTDWATAPGVYTLHGAVTANRAHALLPNFDPQTAALQPFATDPSDAQGGHLRGLWRHTRASGASLRIQSFVDFAKRREPIADYDRSAFDVDVQYQTAVGQRHDLVAGAGYRLVGEQLAGHGGFSLNPEKDTSSLFSAFVQDEIAAFGNRLAVTLGSQMQYNSYSGAIAQPTARVMWKLDPRQRLWAATSRALRTPSLEERGIRVEFPPVPTASGLPLVVTALGDPEAETETLVDAEAGYRLELGSGASIDLTGFAGRYENLKTQEHLAPVLQFVPSPQLRVTSQVRNYLDATTRGLEVSGHWAPFAAWRLDGSYTAFRLRPRLGPESHDPAAAVEDGSAPRTQWQVRSAYSPGARATLHAALFHVGPLRRYKVDGYTRADITAEWRFSSSLSVMAVGQNLFDAAHFEFADAGSFVRSTQVPRSIGLRVRWTSR